MDEFENYIQNITPLSSKATESFINLFVEKKYKAKDIITKAGKIPKKTFFLNSGIVRSFIVFEDGKEYTRRIFSKKTMLSSYTALIKNAPSRFTIECLSDCYILEADYSQVINLAEKNLEVARFIRIFIENLFVSYSERNARFLSLNGTERYLNLRKEIPNIDKLISQKQIANNLGITNIQLSRIRKKINQSS